MPFDERMPMRFWNVTAKLAIKFVVEAVVAVRYVVEAYVVVNLVPSKFRYALLEVK